MISKKKLLVSICSLALVVVVGIASVFSILAALSAKVNGSFNITYTAKNVNAGMLGFWDTGTMDDAPIYRDAKSADITTNGKRYLEISTETAQGNFDPFNIDIIFDSYEKVMLLPQIGFLILNFSEEPLDVKVNADFTAENIEITPIYGTMTNIMEETSPENPKDFTASAPYCGYTNIDDFIFDINIAFLYTFFVTTLNKPDSLIDFLPQLYYISLLSSSSMELKYSDFMSYSTQLLNDQKLSTAENIEELKAGLNNIDESTFNEAISDLEFTFQGMNLTLFYALGMLPLIDSDVFSKLDIKIDFLFINFTTSVPDEILDASISGNFNFTLGQIL